MGGKFKYIGYLMLIGLLGFNPCLYAQQKPAHQQAGKGNPLIPGYFADPTVKKFGDTYYIYATTDGNGGGFGPSQVWMSKDFVNWSMQDMNWPSTHYYWAPDVVQGNDGKYYLYYCQPVEIFGAVADTPVGPWTSLLPAGVPIVPNFLVPNVITLDGQTFRDDDGKYYMYWGTWGIYPNHGCGVGLLNADMKSFSQLAQIPNTVAKDFFEAPFMFKRNGIYYLTYSSGRCEDGTYRVQYVMSKTGPMGPFEFGKNNPILATNADETVHGPGHQSVLQEGNDFYMVYHRHNNPHSGGGFHRQVVADRMVFDTDGNIIKISPTHEGIGFLGKNENPYPNLAYQAKVKASSSYSADFVPAFALDDNNGTLWKPKDNNSPAWLEIDLGKVQPVKSIHTQFEYATWYYQYLISYSIDGKQWQTYADRSKNTKHGSPMVDQGNVKARYLRLDIRNTGYPGINKAVWNIKVFSNNSYQPQGITTSKQVTETAKITSAGHLLRLDAKTLQLGSSVTTWRNTGKLKGVFNAMGSTPTVAMVAGKKALVFAGNAYLKSDFKAPASLKGNRSFTAAMWVFNPVIADEEPILSWTKRGGVELSNAGLGYGSSKKWGAATHLGWADMPYTQLPAAGKWHHIALVFDGTMERLYVNGVLDRAERKMLFVDQLDQLLIGTTTDRNAYFSGALASINLYDLPLPASEIKKMAQENLDADAALYFETVALNYGHLKLWPNEGFAAGKFVAEGIQVSDLQNRIALKLDAKGKLDFHTAKQSGFSFKKPYTLVTQVLAKAGQASVRFNWTVNAGSVKTLCIKGNGKWQHLVHRFDGLKEQTYVDGVLVKPATTQTAGQPKILFSVNANNGSTLQALGTIVVDQYAYSAARVKDTYVNWLKKAEELPSAPIFSIKPRALAPNIVGMAVNANYAGADPLQYYFAESMGQHVSGWTSEKDFINFGLNADQSYSYSVKARDHFGNVTSASTAVKVTTDRSQFNFFEVPLKGTHDFKHAGVKNTFWDSFIGKVDQLILADGQLTMSSAGTKWDGSLPLGPFLYKTLTGNFIAQVKIDDLSGLQEKKVQGANDAGLMVRSNNADFNLVQNSVMLGWGIGNMVTDFGKYGRKQTQSNLAWNFYSYLQIQRQGNLFYVRGSLDGQQWKDLPGSPILRTDMENTPVQVGLFQCTYGEQQGFVKFSAFSIVQPMAN